MSKMIGLLDKLPNGATVIAVSETSHEVQDLTDYCFVLAFTEREALHPYAVWLAYLTDAGSVVTIHGDYYKDIAEAATGFKDRAEQRGLSL